MGFVDLHSHVLPGLDDGSPDAATSMVMLKGLAAIGFERVCATPHQKLGQFMPPLPAIRKAWVSTAQALADEAVELALSLAAENMWDSAFYERCASLTIPSYDDGAAFLFELPIAPQLPVGLFEQLFVLRAKGRLPTLAHPERYEALWSSPDLLERLRDSCALVVDLGAVAGYHGRTRTKFARKWIRDGLVHAVASDAHTPDDVRVAAEGMAWIRNKVGHDAAERLLDIAPHAILAGRHPEE
jgi:protein-tyrosine phosphatase